MAYAFRKMNTHYTLRNDIALAVVAASGTIGPLGPVLSAVAVDQVLERVILPWIADTAIDTPALRDLRWDNGGIDDKGNPRLPLALDFWLTRKRSGEDNIYNLQDGTWLYSEALQRFNATDAVPRDKYVFLYGDTEGIRTSQIQLGTIMNHLLIKGEGMGESDGATPVMSAAAAGIEAYRVNAGDIDHEQYFGAPEDPSKVGGWTAEQQARETSDLTFKSLYFGTDYCSCARLLLDASIPDVVTLPDKLVVRGELVWPKDLDKEPGGRIERAEVVIPGQAWGSSDTDTVIGTLNRPNNGQDGRVSLSGEVDVSSLPPGLQLPSTPIGTLAPSGRYPLAIRVTFFDDTVLKSGTAAFSVKEAATPPPSATTATGAGGYWELTKVETDLDKIEARSVSPELDCDTKTTATSSASGATTRTISTGACKYPLVVNADETTTHTWTSPPQRLTPGHDVAGTLTVSQSGYCWPTGDIAMAGCRQGATTGLLVHSGSGQIIDGTPRLSPWLQGGSFQARFSTNPSEPFSWKVPEGGAARVLMIQFSANSAGGGVRTKFWYDWKQLQGP
jgi:hypothetical protein